MCNGSAPADELLIELAKTGNFLVHGIALDDEGLARARLAVSQAGLDGYATIERIPVDPLPYRDNLANLIIIGDLQRVESSGLKMQDAIRALAPFGRLCARRGGKWEITDKSLPHGMDEWTHGGYDAANSKQSKDTLIEFPLGYRWNAGLPQGKIAALALNNGRLFISGTSTIENLTPAFDPEKDSRLASYNAQGYVTARDAFNGLLLWRRQMGGNVLMKIKPLVAVDDRVYTVSKHGRLLVLVGQTGKTIRDLPTKYAPHIILVDERVVVAATMKTAPQSEAPITMQELTDPEAQIRRRNGPIVEEGTVEAWSTKSGARLWHHSVTAKTMLVDEGKVFIITTSDTAKDQDTSGYNVEAMDLLSGKPLWKVAGKDVLSGNKLLSLDGAGYGAVTLIAHNNPGKHTLAQSSVTFLLSAKDGSILQKCQGISDAGFYHGAIHIGQSKYDPATGQRIGPAEFIYDKYHCAPKYFVNDMTISNRQGEFMFGGPIATDEDPDESETRLFYGGLRSACGFGSVPAYGSLFTGPSATCACFPAQAPGFLTVGPVGKEPSVREMQAAPKLIRGTAYGKQNNKASGQEKTWPMYRYDSSRSSAVDAPAPDQLNSKWRILLAKAPLAGSIHTDWQESLVDPITAPVAAEGAIIVSLVHRNQVIALDEHTGKERWRFTVAGRVDTPPTIYNGLCLFGSKDGYVYSIRLDDGQLCWKMRFAPGDDRMVSHGKVESVWPVVGSVLVADGIAYASAGRVQGSDGGLIVRAFEPASGKILWSRAIPPVMDGDPDWPPPEKGIFMSVNDIMFKFGRALHLSNLKLDAKTGAPMENWLIETQEDRVKKRRFEMKHWIGKKAWQDEEYCNKQLALLAKETYEKDICPINDMGAFVDQSWKNYGMSSTKAKAGMSFGNVRGLTTSWDKRLVCTLLESNEILAVFRDRVKPGSLEGKHSFYDTEPLVKEDVKWRVALPKEHMPTSLILCQNALVVGGGVYSRDGGAKKDSSFCSR